MKPIPLKDQLMKIDAVRAADDVVSKVVRRDSVPEVETDFEVSSDRILAEAEESAAGMNGFYVRMAQAEHPETLREEAIGQARSYRRAAVNLSRSAVRSAAIADEVSSRYNDLTKSKRKRRLPVIGRAPANAFIDLEEANSDHFARGLNIYKLLLILYIGSFAGVVVELGWCLLKHGYIESRAGLVYGPLNLLYGVGAVAITVALYRYRNHSRWLAFGAGMIVGSAVEYVCSWCQETFLGSRSWDYSDMPFNLNGRICLLYAFFWGFLGVLWLKNLYPRIAAVIMKIPDRFGKILTWALLAFFVFDAAVSLVAVYRWYGRTSGIAASNAFWRFIDLRFPDTRMQKIFANLVWSK